MLPYLARVTLFFVFYFSSSDFIVLVSLFSMPCFPLSDLVITFYFSSFFYIIIALPSKIFLVNCSQLISHFLNTCSLITLPPFQTVSSSPPSICRPLSCCRALITSDSQYCRCCERVPFLFLLFASWFFPLYAILQFCFHFPFRLHH